MILSGTQIDRLELLASWTQLLRNTPRVSGYDTFTLGARAKMPPVFSLPKRGSCLPRVRGYPLIYPRIDSWAQKYASDIGVQGEIKKFVVTLVVIRHVSVLRGAPRAYRD